MILCLALLSAAARRLPANEQNRVNHSEDLEVGLARLSRQVDARASALHSASSAV